MSKRRHFATKISELSIEIDDYLDEEGEELNEADRDALDEAMSYLRLAIDQLKG